ncbi:hypothetical protein B9Z55_007339 [Caenorhabditis nigoni]|uniref:Uncharacterized protein n=1 Tax=Caenorhabditis nigoni TaxID=1611254 RepID=A0A2G5V960_9PELO|nr:hypothetical protein B9Z55_007339 [Caenorhabditis nigoni]
MYHHQQRGQFSAAIRWAHHQEQQRQMQIQHEGHWNQLHQQLMQGQVGPQVAQHHHHHQQGDVDAYVIRLADDAQRYKGLFEETAEKNEELKATINLNRLELEAKDRVIADKDRMIEEQRRRIETLEGRQHNEADVFILREIRRQEAAEAAGGPGSPGSPNLPAFLYEAPAAPQDLAPQAEDGAPAAHQVVVQRNEGHAPVAPQALVQHNSRIKQEANVQEKKEVILKRHREPTRDTRDAFERAVQQWRQWEHREEKIEDVDLHIFLFNPNVSTYIPQRKRKATRNMDLFNIMHTIRKPNFHMNLGKSFFRSRYI